MGQIGLDRGFDRALDSPRGHLALDPNVVDDVVAHVSQRAHEELEGAQRGRKKSIRDHIRVQDGGMGRDLTWFQKGEPSAL